MSKGREQIIRALAGRRLAWAQADSVASVVADLAEACISSLGDGGRIFFFGNGGSAAQAEHLAAELVGRYLRDDRPPLDALALSGSGALATALGNDYGFDAVFSRQVEALARPGDVLVGLSTSGRSPNVLHGLAAGRRRDCVTALFTGLDRGGDAAADLDHLLQVPSEETPAIQELHLFFGHLLCELIEGSFVTSA